MQVGDLTARILVLAPKCESTGLKKISSVVMESTVFSVSLEIIADLENK